MKRLQKRPKHHNYLYIQKLLTRSLHDASGSAVYVFDGRLDAVQCVFGGSGVVFGAFVPAVDGAACAGQVRNAGQPLVRGGRCTLALDGAGGRGLLALSLCRRVGRGRRRGLNFDTVYACTCYKSSVPPWLTSYTSVTQTSHL